VNDDDLVFETVNACTRRLMQRFNQRSVGELENKLCQAGKIRPPSSFTTQSQTPVGTLTRRAEAKSRLIRSSPICMWVTAFEGQLERSQSKFKF
jgi:hypothetical protein